MFKIVIPYVILGVVFAELNKALQLPPFSLLLVALAVVDSEWNLQLYKGPFLTALEA